MFSDKRFIVYVYALKTSCLCPYKESEISQSGRSDFRGPIFCILGNSIVPDWFLLEGIGLNWMTF